MPDSARPSNMHAATEHIVREMTEAQLNRAGIQADYWHGGPTYYRDGRELNPCEKVLLPAVAPDTAPIDQQTEST
ncbi:hypothetical protein SGL43_06575 [Streptomyces globisporus]|uniref:Uncharacterized protein n=1 Tax=Streptomyces globisporus TaxID=1908 RepID=A0ABN8V9M2_STRGL|nr:hypothetical protein [Streptomyces globisporus]CAH9419520.1 hypothetical protein SGL43_06575 [Streptomyces globisporus]